jgi:hypothetical protein
MPPRATASYVEYDPRADVVRTARYRIGMRDALPSEFQLAGAPGATGDLLDGLRLRAQAPWRGNLATTIFTEADARHRLLAWNDGPVRTVRVSEHDVRVALGLHLSAGVARTYFYPLHVRGPGRMRLPISPGTLFVPSMPSPASTCAARGLALPRGGTDADLPIDGTTSPPEAAFDARPLVPARGDGQAILTALG